MAIFEIVRRKDGEPEDMIIKDVNKAYVNTLGISRENVVNQSASIIYGPDFVQKYFKLVQSEPEISKGKNFETYFPPLDTYYLTALFKIGTDLYTTLGIDITERKKLEMELENERDNLESKIKERTKELQDSQNKLIKAQKIAHIGNWELYLKDNRLWFSDEVYHIFGYDSEEISAPFDLNKLNITYDFLINTIVHPDDRDLLDKPFKNAIKANSPYSIDHRIILPSGEVRIIHEEGRIVNDDKGIPVKMVGTTQDVTKLKEIEKALKESEEKFREIFDKANDMISLNEMKDGFPGKFIEINEVATKRLGYTKEELLNMGPKDIVAPDKRQEMPKNAAKLLKDSCNTFETVHLTKNGKKIPVEVNNHLINYQGRKVCLAISRDISERKKSEIRLNELLNKLSTSNEELEQFAYIISHDLQEPLRTISNFTELLQRRYEGKFDSDADEFMDYIVDASHRMSEMIHDLLDYSRVSTSKEEIKAIDLNKLIENVVSDLKFTIEENNAIINHEKLPVVMGDYDKLTRVFLNFISNAMKFKKDDVAPQIYIGADEGEDEYIISVKDNGIGIDKKYYDRIFEIFQRLHTRDKYKGSGIGLAITKKIIEMHGGRIWVDSKPGEGSSFFFTLKKP